MRSFTPHSPSITALPDSSLAYMVSLLPVLPAKALATPNCVLVLPDLDIRSKIERTSDYSACLGGKSGAGSNFSSLNFYCTDHVEF